MSDARPFASLTSGLLARKGFARPAMRPQGHALTPSLEDLGWNDMGSHVAEVPAQHPPVSFLTPLNNDAEPAPLAAAEAPVPEVLRQQAEIEQEFGVDEAFDAVAEPAAPVAPAVLTPAKPKAARKAPAKRMVTPRAPRTRAAAGNGAKAAFTLRLDPERHLRLRLACAVGHRSAQRLLINALDAYLDAIPGLDEIAANVPDGRPA